MSPMIRCRTIMSASERQCVHRRGAYPTPPQAEKRVSIEGISITTLRPPLPMERMEAMTSKNRVGRPLQNDDRLPQQKICQCVPPTTFRVQRRRKLGFILGDASVVLVAAIPDRAPCSAVSNMHRCVPKEKGGRSRGPHRGQYRQAAGVAASRLMPERRPR
jgi:hypothetical protein